MRALTAFAAGLCQVHSRAAARKAHTTCRQDSFALDVRVMIKVTLCAQQRATCRTLNPLDKKGEIRRWVVRGERERSEHL